MLFYGTYIYCLINFNKLIDYFVDRNILPTLYLYKNKSSDEFHRNLLTGRMYQFPDEFFVILIELTTVRIILPESVNKII